MGGGRGKNWVQHNQISITLTNFTSKMKALVSVSKLEVTGAHTETNIIKSGSVAVLHFTKAKILPLIYKCFELHFCPATCLQCGCFIYHRNNIIFNSDGNSFIQTHLSYCSIKASSNPRAFTRFILKCNFDSIDS
jgi:hypothetical protein